MDLSAFISKYSQILLLYVPKILLAIFTLVVGLRLIKWVGRLIDAAMQRKGFDQTIRPFIESVVNVGLKIMLLLSVASMFGIQTTSFVAIFAALTFAIGSALSGSLGHLASGVILLIFRPYKVGDLVTIGGSQTGIVREIQVFNTLLITGDNREIIIPNGMITSNIMTNISAQGNRRVDMTFNVTADADIDTVRAVIKEVSDKCPLILDEPAIGIFVNELPVGMIEFVVRPWCESSDYWKVHFYMKENVKKAFKSGDITHPINTFHLDMKDKDKHEISPT